MDPRRLPCTFPPADKHTYDDADDRNLKVGDEVCVKQIGPGGAFRILPGIIASVAPSDDGLAHQYGVKGLPSALDRRTKITTVAWTHIGIPAPISVGEKNPTTLNWAFERNNPEMPEDIKRKVGSYGGKKTRKGRKGRKARRTTRKR